MYIGDGAGSLQNNIATDPPELGIWQHIAVTVSEDGDVVHYLNGELNGEGVVQADAIDNDTNLFIGGRADFVTNMLGRLDDVAIFNEVLSQEQIQMIQTGEFGAFGVGDFLPGDFNGDEVVDMADFNIMVSNFNTAGAFADGDFNFNGQIELSDFAKFRTVFNAAPVAAAASVPEPACLLLLGFPFLVMLDRMRRR